MTTYIILAICVVIAGAYLYGRKAGRDAERAHNATAGLERARKARMRDAEIDGLDDDELNRRLRGDS